MIGVGLPFLRVTSTLERVEIGADGYAGYGLRWGAVCVWYKRRGKYIVRPLVRTRCMMWLDHKAHNCTIVGQSGGVDLDAEPLLSTSGALILAFTLGVMYGSW